MAHSEHKNEGTGAYVKVLVALLVLTLITVFTAKFLDLGVTGNTILALGIASLKAFLVATIFMHLKHESPLTWAYASFPIVLLIILIGGLLIDNPLRYIP